MAFDDEFYEKLYSLKHKIPCDCYECVGPEYEYGDNGYKFVINNFKYHTFLEECEKCGEKKTEYRDLGRKGYYMCWWCNDRNDEKDFIPCFCDEAIGSCVKCSENSTAEEVFEGFLNG